MPRGLGTYRRHVPRVLGVLAGWAFSYGRDTPVVSEKERETERVGVTTGVPHLKNNATP
jgi:hypothetical protein